METKAELMLENSLASWQWQPALTVWGSLAAPDQKVLGPPRACPCLPRLVKDRPATQGAGETGTSGASPASLLLSLLPWMQELLPGCRNPPCIEALGASHGGPASHRPPEAWLTCWPTAQGGVHSAMPSTRGAGAG